MILTPVLSQYVGSCAYVAVSMLRPEIGVWYLPQSILHLVFLSH